MHLDKEKQTQWMESYQSQQKSMALWTCLSEHVISEKSAEMTDESEKHNHWLNRVRMWLKGAVVIEILSQTVLQTV